MEQDLVVGIDLGGTNMQFGVVDREGNVLARSKNKTRAEQGLDRVLERLVEGYHKAVAEAEVHPDRIAACGVGAPGAVHADEGVVVEAPNLRWENVQLAGLLTDRLGVPTVLENDVNAAIVGEWLFGAGRGETDLLGVWCGTGVGGGLILNNELYRGARLTAGEIGHMTLFPRAPRAWRTIEQNCSRTAVVEQLTKLIQSNHHSSLVTLTNGKLEKMRSRLIGQAYREGDPLTRKVVDTAADLLGEAIAGVATLLSLPKVVLGGGLTEAIGAPFVGRVEQAVMEYVFPPARSNGKKGPSGEDLSRVVVVETALRDDAGVVGAAVQARRRLNAGFAEQTC